MAVGTNALHLIYLQNTSFLRTRRLLMHDLEEPSNGDSARFWRSDQDELWRTDPDPVSLNVRPETLKRWLARRLLMICHSSTIGPPQPFPWLSLGTAYPLDA